MVNTNRYYYTYMCYDRCKGKILSTDKNEIMATVIASENKEADRKIEELVGRSDYILLHIEEMK